MLECSLKNEEEFVNGDGDKMGVNGEGDEW